jgi:hypothetical protein
MKAFGHALDLLLTFQVKGASRGSDEAMGHLQNHIGPGTSGAFSDRRPLNPVTLAEGDDFLTLDVHDPLLDLIRCLFHSLIAATVSCFGHTVKSVGHAGDHHEVALIS